jgi:hypothetical protein
VFPQFEIAAVCKLLGLSDCLCIIDTIEFVNAAEGSVVGDGISSITSTQRSPDVPGSEQQSSQVPKVSPGNASIANIFEWEVGEENCHKSRLMGKNTVLNGCGEVCVPVRPHQGPDRCE